MASVMRKGNNKTGVLTFLSNMVRTPGETTQVWDINNSQHSETLMANIAESSDNNNNDLMNNAFLRAHNAQYNSEGYTIPDGVDVDVNGMELVDIDDNTYIVSRALSMTVFASLIDRGANGGIAGDDVRLIEYDRGRTINVTGIDNHQLPHLKLATFGAYARTQNGPVILIFNQSR